MTWREWLGWRLLGPEKQRQAEERDLRDKRLIREATTPPAVDDWAPESAVEQVAPRVCRVSIPAEDKRCLFTGTLNGESFEVFVDDEDIRFYPETLTTQKSRAMRYQAFVEYIHWLVEQIKPRKQ